MFKMMTIMNLFSHLMRLYQPWRFVTLGYNLPRTSASTTITTFIGFQNQLSHTNIHLVPTNLEMERLHLLNKLEQLRHVEQRIV